MKIRSVTHTLKIFIVSTMINMFLPLSSIRVMNFPALLQTAHAFRGDKLSLREANRPVRRESRAKFDLLGRQKTLPAQ